MNIKLDEKNIQELGEGKKKTAWQMSNIPGTPAEGTQPDVDDAIKEEVKRLLEGKFGDEKVEVESLKHGDAVGDVIKGTVIFRVH